MICISIQPKSLREAKQLLKITGKLTDIVELRLELINSNNYKEIFKSHKPKLIITCRKSKHSYSNSDILVIHDAIESGAEYVDVDIAEGGLAIADVIQHARMYPFLKTVGIKNWKLKFDDNITRHVQDETRRTKVILSYHNFEQTPPNIGRIFSEMKKYGADILKIAVKANDISDNVKIFKLLGTAKKQNEKLTAFCMGEKGEVSRILSPKFGGYMTYCSLEEGKETGNGQLPVEKMLKVYNYNSINEDTKIFGLIGNPVDHSRGIYLHNEFFKKKKIDAVYLNFLIDDPEKFLKSYSDYLTGASVTIPFKEIFIKLVDELSPEAYTTKSVNTILRVKNKWKGYNTDYKAIYDLLKHKAKGKIVAVIGTGGSARSTVCAAMSLGAKVFVAGRNLTNARKLSLEFGCKYTDLRNIDSVKPDIIINTTPLGMQPYVNASPIPASVIKKNMLIVDFVYTPPQTKLFKIAKSKGCKTISGVQIFKRQAKLQQELFLSAFHSEDVK